MCSTPNNQENVKENLCGGNASWEGYLATKNICVDDHRPYGVV